MILFILFVIFAGTLSFGLAQTYRKEEKYYMSSLFLMIGITALIHMAILMAQFIFST